MCRPRGDGDGNGNGNGIETGGGGGSGGGGGGGGPAGGGNGGGSGVDGVVGGGGGSAAGGGSGGKRKRLSELPSQLLTPLVTFLLENPKLQIIKSSIAFAEVHSTAVAELTKKAVKSKISEVGEYKGSRCELEKLKFLSPKP